MTDLREVERLLRLSVRMAALGIPAPQSPIANNILRQLDALGEEGEVLATGNLVGSDTTGRLTIQVKVDGPFIGATGQRVRVVREKEIRP